MATADCIYCGLSFDPSKGQGDHVVPSALGKFKGALLFRRICRECNNSLSKSEEQLLRCAPEALLRHMVNPSTGRPRGRSPNVGAAGKPPPRTTVEHEGCEFELVAHWNPDGKTVSAPEQLVVKGVDGKDHHIKLHPKMTAATLREKIDAIAAEYKLQEAAYLSCHDDNSTTYVELLREKRPELRYDPQPTMGIGVHRVKATTEFAVGEGYWRAIAKIAFHYYLMNSPRKLRGDEPEFSAIRTFIMEGGDRSKFIKSPKKFLWSMSSPLMGNIVPMDWVHLLAGEESNTQVTIAVCLFAGPETNPGVFPRVHNVSIGMIDRRIHVVQPAFGHSYVYYPVNSRVKYDGEVRIALPSRVR